MKLNLDLPKHKWDSLAKHLDVLRNQENIILGLISLQAGNPDQALEYVHDILKQNNKFLVGPI